MKYEINGKKINIPDKELEKLQKTLDLTFQEALETWLCDHDYENNEEQEELNKKAKDNRITATIHQAKTEEKKTRKTREKKEDPLKRSIIDAIYSGLCRNLPASTDIDITNEERTINLIIDGVSFSINLTKHRK